MLDATDETNLDMEPWYNVTAKITVTSTYSVQSNNYIEDTFKISVVDKCRMVSLNTAMNVDSTGAGRGTATNPYTIEMFQVLSIPMTATTFNGPNTDPWNTANFDRCSVTTTLHYNSVDRIAVDASTPLYQFNSQSQASELKIHWRSQDGVFQDYFVIQTKVIYTRTSEVIVLDEGFVYVTITNPCTVAGVINSQTIADISYTIKDS